MNNIVRIIFIFILLSCSCTGEKIRKKEIKTASGNVVTKAERFMLHRTDSCTILTITDPWQGAGGILQEYYLVKKSSGRKLMVDSSLIVYVPVNKIICMSTTHLAMIKALGEENSIAGISGSDFIYDRDISERIADGQISDVGYDAGINSELIIKIDPDLVIIYGIGSESIGYTGKITELGIKVMIDADYLETDPLGKAEWIKLFGALFCREEMADSVYSNIVESYNQVKEYISQNAVTRPMVLLGLPFRDTWYISPGNSYISKLIGDAGGTYLWESTESSVSMPFGLENVYLQALKSDFWLNIGSITSKHEIISLDPRLGTIPPFRNEKLFNNNKRITEKGGNDYWESGTLNPHTILKDIAAILHPGIFGNYEPVYYTKIE